MRGNRGATRLRLKRSHRNPMQDYDRLPAELRAWLAEAILPWRPRSAERAFNKAKARCGDADSALRELDRLQARLVAGDVRRIWGPDHPHATPAAEQ